MPGAVRARIPSAPANASANLHPNVSVHVTNCECLCPSQCRRVSDFSPVSVNARLCPFRTVCVRFSGDSFQPCERRLNVCVRFSLVSACVLNVCVRFSRFSVSAVRFSHQPRKPRVSVSLSSSDLVQFGERIRTVELPPMSPTIESTAISPNVKSICAHVQRAGQTGHSDVKRRRLEI